jgi:hypothetical protein
LRIPFLDSGDKDYHQKRVRGEAGPLELRSLLSAFLGVANAVAYAHSRGVLHRDLKGNNVVLGDYGQVIVLDWGLAKVLSGEGENLAAVSPRATDQTVSGQVLGTPAFMAPEQAAGRTDQIGPRTDVYGLGAMLYEILTARPPHSGSSVEELLERVRTTSPQRPTAINPAVPRPLEAVCLRAMAFEPENRYASASELADEVQRWLADEPLRAYREPLSVRCARVARRHKPLVTATVALLTTAVAALAISCILIHREQVRTEAARAQAEAYYRASEVQRQRAESNLQRAVAIVDEMVHRVGAGRTPDEVYFRQRPLNRSPRFEPRALWPRPAPCALPQVLVKGQPGARIKLEVSYQHSRKHLPIAVIRRAA